MYVFSTSRVIRDDYEANIYISKTIREWSQTRFSLVKRQTILRGNAHGLNSRVDCGHAAKGNIDGMDQCVITV